MGSVMMIATKVVAAASDIDVIGTEPILGQDFDQESLLPLLVL